MATSGLPPAEQEDAKTSPQIAQGNEGGGEKVLLGGGCRRQLSLQCRIGCHVHSTLVSSTDCAQGYGRLGEEKVARAEGEQLQRARREQTHHALLPRSVTDLISALAIAALRYF